jgi:uncharacterized Zn finger protein
MTRWDGPRFDPATLRRLAGDKVYPRGVAYHAEGRVRLLAADAARVLARVAGSETYRVELTGGAGNIGGVCACPAFDDWGFCKHMVAVALAVNEAGPAIKGADTLARIEAHLRRMGTDALVALVMELVARDGGLLQRLDLAAAAPGESAAQSEARLRRAIDEATRPDHVADNDGAGDWANGIAAVLEAIEGQLAVGRAGLALRLAVRLMDRTAAALEEIDDSNGDGYAVLERARDLHRGAAIAAKPDPVALARELFRRETGSGHDAFAGAASLYAEALGAAGRAEYRRLAEAAWREVPVVQPRSDGRGALPVAHLALRGIIDAFAAADDDVDTRIALRAKQLPHAHSYLDLASFCLSVGRPAEAMRWAEEGLWIAGQSVSARPLLVFLAERLAEAGRTEDALAHLKRAFEAAPDETLYERLCTLGGAGARDWAIASLRRRLPKAGPSSGTMPADLLLRILIREGRIEDGLAILRQHGVSRLMQQALAEAGETTHPEAALTIYAACIEDLILDGTGDSYGRAVALLGRMAALRPAGPQAAHVAALRQRFARRRSLIKLLG